MSTGLERGVGSSAISVAVAAELVFAIIAAFCSSPQTAHLNAKDRAGTLMLWVSLGTGAAILFTAVLVILDSRRWPPLLGAGMALAVMWCAYKYAIRWGLQSNEPPTEKHGGDNGFTVNENYA